MPIDWWFSASHVSHPIFKGSAGTAGTSTARQSILDLAAKPRAKIWRVMPHFTSGIMVIYAYIYIIKVYIYNDVQPARNRYIMWVKWLVVCKLCIIKHGLFHILHWSYLGCTPKSTPRNWLVLLDLSFRWPQYLESSAKLLWVMSIHLVKLLHIGHFLRTLLRNSAMSVARKHNVI
jgi:hypothetical protein